MGDASWVHYLLAISSWNSPLLEEWPSLNCLKSALVFLTSEPMSVELHIRLWGHTRTFSGGIFRHPLSRELPWSHFLQGYIHKVSLHKIPIITTQAKQLKWCKSLSTKCKCQRALRQQSHIGACAILWCISMYMHIYFFERHFMIYIHVYIFWRAFYEVYPCIYIFFFKGILWCICMHIHFF